MSDTVQVNINGGPGTEVAWFQNMNAQQALESAYSQINNDSLFTYAIQYYGKFGYMLIMVNETYDSFLSSSSPYFYWEFLLNGEMATAGIDSVILQPNDTISFSFEMYVPAKHDNGTSAVSVKHTFQTQAIKSGKA